MPSRPGGRTAFQIGGEADRGEALEVGGHRLARRGLLHEGTLLGGAESEIFTPLVGLELDVTELLRIDVFAELGGHRVSDVGSGNGAALETRAAWLPYVGVRPSLSPRLPPGRSASSSPSPLSLAGIW